MQKLLRSYGNEMQLLQGEQTHSIRAFLQDTLSRSKENAQREFTPLGEIFKGQFVYIGPAEPMAAVGDTLVFQGRRFELRRAEPVMVGNLVAYCWGLCIEKGGDSTWGS